MTEQNVTMKEKYNSSDTWQQKASVVYLYHTIMSLQYKDWNLTDTSQHFEISIGLASENIRLAKEMDINPKIEKCKTREEGLKLIEKRRYTERSEIVMYRIEDE